MGKNRWSKIKKNCKWQFATRGIAKKETFVETINYASTEAKILSSKAPL
jgi:hypothetical protein